MRLIPLSIGILALAGCAGTGLTPAVDGKPQTWSLVRVELDRANLANAGRRVPLYPRPTGESFGLIPNASGHFLVTRDQRVNCRIAIGEPVVGLGGERSWSAVDVVNFFGVMTPEGNRVERQDGVTQSAILGEATVLHVKRIDSDTISVQAATGDKLIPYVYYFGPKKTREAPVLLPYID